LQIEIVDQQPRERQSPNVKPNDVTVDQNDATELLAKPNEVTLVATENAAAANDVNPDRSAATDMKQEKRE
jgi:hypothetical protein